MVRVLGPICVVLAGLTACYSPPEPNCGFICGPGGACPDHYACNSNGQCQRLGSPATACNTVDSGVGFDEGSFDVQFADADVTGPTVTSIFPGADTTTSDHFANVYVYFSEGVYSVDSNTFQVTIAAVQVPGTVSPASLEGGSAWAFYPSSAYPGNTEVDIQLTGGIYDYAGNPLQGAPVFSRFFTGP